MELLEKILAHWDTLSMCDLIPVAYISLLIFWIVASNRYGTCVHKKSKKQRIEIIVSCAQLHNALKAHTSFNTSVSVRLLLTAMFFNL